MYKNFKYGIIIFILIIFLLVYDFFAHYQSTPDVWDSEWFRMRIAMFTFFIGALIGYILFKRTQRAKIKQQEFTDRIMKARESEWKQITAELHDNIGQNLTYINNQILQLANSMNGSGKKEELMNISKNLLSSVDEIRSLMSKLYPHQLERLGFKKSVEALLTKIGSTFGLNIHYEIENIDELLSDEICINLYRILQEALNNVTRHSNAKNVYIKLKTDDSRIFFSIDDDGEGFDAGILKSVIGSGYGINLMKERVRIIGGRIRIDSRLGEGTKITISFPK